MPSRANLLYDIKRRRLCRRRPSPPPAFGPAGQPATAESLNDDEGLAPTVTSVAGTLDRTTLLRTWRSQSSGLSGFTTASPSLNLAGPPAIRSHPACTIWCNKT